MDRRTRQKIVWTAEDLRYQGDILLNKFLLLYKQVLGNHGFTLVMRGEECKEALREVMSKTSEGLLLDMYLLQYPEARDYYYERDYKENSLSTFRNIVDNEVIARVQADPQMAWTIFKLAGIGGIDKHNVRRLNQFVPVDVVKKEQWYQHLVQKFNQVEDAASISHLVDYFFTLSRDEFLKRLTPQDQKALLEKVPPPDNVDITERWSRSSWWEFIFDKLAFDKNELPSNTKDYLINGLKGLSKKTSNQYWTDYVNTLLKEAEGQ